MPSKLSASSCGTVLSFIKLKTNKLRLLDSWKGLVSIFNHSLSEILLISIHHFLNSNFCLFSERYLNERAALFPTAEWAQLSVSDALARLQEQLNSARQLAQCVKEVTLEVQDLEIQLYTLNNQRTMLNKQVATNMEQQQLQKAKLKDHEAELARTTVQVENLDLQVETQEIAVSSRRARLQALANEAAQLWDSTQRVIHDLRTAHHGRVLALALVGASTYARANNLPAIRNAIGKFLTHFFKFHCWGLFLVKFSKIPR